MSTFQKVIKYLALYFALALVVGIVFVSITAINSIWYIFGNEGSNERNNVATYESATNLKIDLKISKLTIKTGDTLRVESNNENIKYENQFGTLKIVEDKHFSKINNSLISISKSLAISKKVSIEGCTSLVHHLEIVTSLLPNCSANHLLVFSFSAKTIFNRLILIVCYLINIRR